MTESQREFPTAFLEAGSDSNHNYLSMKLIRQSDGSLRIDLVGWSIEETGISLSADISGSTLNLIIMGECGVVNSWTWTKVSFIHIIEREKEKELRTIEYRCGLLKLTVGKGW